MNEPREPEDGHMVLARPSPMEPVIINEANRRYWQQQAEINKNREKLRYWEEKKQDAERRKNALLNNLGVPVDVATVIYRWNLWGLLFAIPLMAGVTFAVTYIALLPSFYARKLWAAVIASAAAISAVIGVELFLHGLERVLAQRYRQLFNAIVTILMVACLFGGMMQLAQARALQMKLQSCETESVLEDESKAATGSDVDIDDIKKRIDRLNRRGMILLAVSFDWLFGLYVFRARKNYLTFKPLMNALRDEGKAENKIQKLRVKNAGMGA